MCRLVFVFLISLFISGINSLIVPDEVPSLLSVIYSNLPPIKKGTDSRLGWGFRLGDHADIQILLELGPQTNTRPLSNDDKDRNNKRDAVNNFRNTLYAQAQLLKQRMRQQQEKFSDSDGGKWLQKWSQQMRQPTTAPEIVISNADTPMIGVGEVDASKVFPDELEELYGNKQESKNIQKIAPGVSKASSTENQEKTGENNNEGQSFFAKLARG